MIHVKNPNQRDIFDPWDFVTPKRRQMLEDGWPGLFRNFILPTIPAEKIFKHFDVFNGRPTKELNAALGALILQQVFDLTDDETVEQFCFNIQWHYALNITEESDSAKYICAKTLWNYRSIVSQEELEDAIFSAASENLAEVFNVNTDHQRIDSVHIKSNMRKLGRIGIFSASIHTFLKNMRRGHSDYFNSIGDEIKEKYLTKTKLSCFSRVKPSESRKTLAEVSKDLFALVQQFKGIDEVASMYSYKMLVRVLEEHCNLSGDKANPVEIKKPKEIPSSSLQNPSDPEASYSGHKGQGYQVQVMETFCKDGQAKEQSLNLITHVDVESAHESDANALIPAIESSEKRNLKPKQVTADSLYASDHNSEEAKKRGVELIAPTMGAAKGDKLSLSDFQVSDKGEILACPNGHCPEKVSINKKVSVAFGKQHCCQCPKQLICPAKEGKNFFYFRFSPKDIRLMRRREYEQSDEFKEQYRWRAGVEATMSEYDRRTGVKQLRVRGKRAVKFSAVLKALGVNIFRATAVRISRMIPENELCMA